MYFRFTAEKEVLRERVFDKRARNGVFYCASLSLAARRYRVKCPGLLASAISGAIDGFIGPGESVRTGAFHASSSGPECPATLFGSGHNISEAIANGRSGCRAARVNNR